MNSCHRQSVTLLELLIAITLLGMLVLGFISISLFSHYHVKNADIRMQLQNEASSVIGHMSKQIVKAIGDFNNPVIVAYNDNKGIRIRIDDNPANGRIDAADTWIAYRHENIGSGATDSEIRYYPNAGTGGMPSGLYDSVAHHVAITNLADPPDRWGLALYINFDAGGHLLENYIEVQIICRWQPAQVASSDNPEVVMRTKIKMPAVSTN